MSLSSRREIRDRYRLNGSLGQPFPAMAPEHRFRAPLIRDPGLRGRDPFESLRGGGGLGRYNDSLSRLSRRGLGSEPIYGNLDPLTRVRLPDLDQMLASRRHPYGHNHYDSYPSLVGLGCDDCRRAGRRCDLERDREHRCDHHCDRGHGYSCKDTKSSSSSSKSDSGCKKTYEFKTKDITVRGKSYCVRKSFLADCGKFEGDLIKFVDKKKDDQLPDRVVQMLIDFINEEGCTSRNVLDFVLMNVLASNLGAKSAIEYSSNELKRFDIDRRWSGDELTNLSAAVLMSNKVEKGLEAWLKKLLSYDRNLDIMYHSYHFQGVLDKHPELGVKVETLMGIRDNVEDDSLPVLD